MNTSLDLLSSVCNYHQSYFTRAASATSSSNISSSHMQTPTIIINRHDLLSCSSTLTTTQSSAPSTASTTRDKFIQPAACSPHPVFHLAQNSDEEDDEQYEYEEVIDFNSTNDTDTLTNSQPTYASIFCNHKNSMCVLLAMATGIHDSQTNKELIDDVDNDDLFKKTKNKAKWKPTLKDLCDKMKWRKTTMCDASKTSSQKQNKKPTMAA